jgi:hypothetical protein
MKNRVVVKGPDQKEKKYRHCCRPRKKERKIRIMLSREQEVQECDATKTDSSNDAGKTIKTLYSYFKKDQFYDNFLTKRIICKNNFAPPI